MQRRPNPPFNASYAVLTIAAIMLGAPCTVSAQEGVDRALFDALKAACPTAVSGSRLDTVCNIAFSGRGLSGPGSPFVAGAVGTNFSTAGTQSSTEPGAGQGRCLGSREECRQKAGRKAGGASADFSLDNVGFTVSLQAGRTNRADTTRESGYESDLLGALVGMDYKFSDRFLAGLLLGYSQTRSAYNAGGGDLDSSVLSATLQTTYALSDNSYLGGYLSARGLENDSRRTVIFGGITGVALSRYRGDQAAAGLSSGFDRPIGDWTIGAYVNLDYFRTRIDGFAESGTTGLELQFPSQRVDSLATTFGARLSRRIGFDWGTLSPEVRLAAVHEFRNDSRAITSRLVLTPATTITSSTDAPDRNYLLGAIGVNAELSRGTRLFVDYEARAKHDYLRAWALSAGVIFGF